jgi:hypothetical protein
MFDTISFEEWWNDVSEIWEKENCRFCTKEEKTSAKMAWDTRNLELELLRRDIDAVIKQRDNLQKLINKIQKLMENKNK